MNISLKKFYVRNFAMKYVLLLVALATLSLRSCLCDDSVSELVRFDRAAQQKDTHKEAVQQSSFEQDENEIAQALSSLVTNEQEYANKQTDQDSTESQDFDNRDLQVGRFIKLSSLNTNKI